MKPFKLRFTPLLLIIIIATCTPESKKNGETSEEKMEVEVAEEEKVDEASYDVPTYDPTTVVEYDRLGLDVTSSNAAINDRLEELHIPVHPKIKSAGISTEEVQNDEVLHTTVLYLLKGDIKKLKGFYKAVLANVAQEQGWMLDETSMVAKDTDGNKKLELRFFDAAGSTRMALDFFDPVVE